MLAKQNRTNAGLGKLDIPKPNQPILKVIDFIKSNLIDLPKDIAGKNIENENGLTQELCDLLNDKAGGEMFWFHIENMEDTAKGNSPRVDMAAKTRKPIIINSQPIERRKVFFKVEAKRLPTGSGDREKEYVIGLSKKKNGKLKENGGIERFKKGIHSPDLPYGGIIGYVQRDDFEKWCIQINLWIEELYDSTKFWNENDNLKLLSTSNQLEEYQSKNRRINSSSSEIVLHHFWIKM